MLSSAFIFVQGVFRGLLATSTCYPYQSTQVEPFHPRADPDGISGTVREKRVPFKELLHVRGPASDILDVRGLTSHIRCARLSLAHPLSTPSNCPFYFQFLFLTPYCFTFIIFTFTLCQRKFYLYLAFLKI